MDAAAVHPRIVIRIEKHGEGEWSVTVEGGATTTHHVRVSPSDLIRFGGAGVSAEALLEASFRFLLERESNTSILPSFHLPLIARYFPEYEKELPRYLRRE
jgi:hypothetical protein